MNFEGCEDYIELNVDTLEISGDYPIPIDVKIDNAGQKCIFTDGGQS